MQVGEEEKWLTERAKILVNGLLELWYVLGFCFVL